MARRQLTYTELRVALFVLATVALLIVGIFYVTGSGAWQSKYTLKTYLPEADGLVEGAPVSLGGVHVGNVSELSINPQARTPDQNIEVDMQIFKRYQQWIRTNSTATLDTQGALGNRFVSISRGTPPSAVIPNGGMVPGVPASTIPALLEHANALLDNVNGLATDLRSISDQIHSGKGTLGQLLYDDRMYNRLNDTVNRADDMMARLQSGQGTAGKLLTSDDLYNRANDSISRVDSLLAGVQSGKGTLGKLVTDPTLYNNANSFLAKGNTVLSDAEAGKGTLGKLVTDPTLYNNVSEASARLRDLTVKLDEGQGTAGKFFTDPQLYNNLAGLSGDLRLLIRDFRRDPKKYLRIRVSLF